MRVTCWRRWKIVSMTADKANVLHFNLGAWIKFHSTSFKHQLIKMKQGKQKSPNETSSSQHFLLFSIFIFDVTFGFSYHCKKTVRKHVVSGCHLFSFVARLCETGLKSILYIGQNISGTSRIENYSIFHFGNRQPAGVSEFDFLLHFVAFICDSTLIIKANISNVKMMISY